MYKNKKILAVVPARGGSKGIPKKNIVEVSGKPLIAYTLDAAKSSKYIDRIIVSTDSEEIAAVARMHGGEVPYLRPDHLATDQAKTIDVLIDVVAQLERASDAYDFIVLLQPTQPLRLTIHIDEAIEQIIDQNLASLVSVSLAKESPLLLRSISKDGKLIPLLDKNSTVRRQEFPAYYRVNGAIYINRINSDFNAQTSLNDNQYAYIMPSEYDIDIDEPMDLEMFQYYLERINRR